jgi:hypothetical protein
MHLTKEHISIIQTKQKDLVNHPLVEIAVGEVEKMQQGKDL